MSFLLIVIGQFSDNLRSIVLPSIFDDALISSPGVIVGRNVKSEYPKVVLGLIVIPVLPHCLLKLPFNPTV